MSEGQAPDTGAAAPPTLTMDATEVTIPAGGGISKHQLTNPRAVRVAFKMKSNNNVDCRLNPVFGFVEPQKTASFEITRTAPKMDKLEVHYKETPAGCTDAKILFVEEISKLTVNMIAE